MIIKMKSYPMLDKVKAVVEAMVKNTEIATRAKMNGSGLKSCPFRKRKKKNYVPN